MKRHTEIIGPLAPGWRLEADPLQFIMTKRRGSEWKPEAYIAEKTCLVRRTLRERGVSISQEGDRLLRRLSERPRKYLDALFSPPSDDLEAA